MLWLLAALVVALVVFFLLFELRIRRPDVYILQELGDVVRQRTGRLYWRRLALPIRATAYGFTQRIAAEARGHLAVDVELSLTVAVDAERLPELVRAGGWRPDAVQRAARELETAVLSAVGAFIEERDIDAILREDFVRSVQSALDPAAAALGLLILAVSVRDITPGDAKIAEAIRRREAARVAERSESAEQAARVAAARARVAADEEIAATEHALEMKRLQQREEREAREAVLARRRVEEQNEQRRLELAVDGEEVELLRRNPELLLLTPQVARLAEASQSLPNARTVVSLSGGGGGGDETAPVVDRLLALVERAISRGSEETAGTSTVSPRRGA